MSQIINVGNNPNDGLGDKLRDAFIIVNENFASIDTLLSGTDVLTISQITGLQTALNNIQIQLDYIPGLQSDINSINNTIYTINQTLNSQNSSIADLYNEITNLQTQIYTKVEEAPIDGESYVRKDAGWVLAPTQSGGVYATPSLQEVITVNPVSNQGFTINDGGGSITEVTSGSFSVVNGVEYINMYPQAISFQNSDSGKVLLKVNPTQLSTALPTFTFPAKAVTGVYLLATTSDYTLQAVTSLQNTTNNGIQFQPTGVGVTGSKYITIQNSQVFLNSLLEGYSTITNDKIIWSRNSNIVSLSGWGAAGSNSANFILPTKTFETYTLATTNDLYTVSSLNANNLNIITSGSGTSVGKFFNARGLTSSNNTISITGTGSNNNTNWGWDIKSNITKTSDLTNDGEDGEHPYITLLDLPSNLILFPTTEIIDASGYYQMVTSIDDIIYDNPAVDIPTGDITGAAQLIASLITEAGLITGNPGIFNVSTIGNIRKISGSGTAEFYFEIYKRDISNVETLVGVSNPTLPVNNGVYAEFSATAIWDDGVFTTTDKIVIKYYANRIAGGSNPEYEFQFGGLTPVRTLVPIPLSVVPAFPYTPEDVANKENTLLDNSAIKYPSNNLVKTFLDEDFIPKNLIDNQLTYMITPLGNSGYTTLRIGNLVQVNNQGLSSFPTGVQYVTTAVAGTIGFFRGTSITLSSGNFVTKSRFKMVTIDIGARFFHGFSTMYRTAAPTNIEPDTMINSMGVCKLSTSDNFHFIHNDGSGIATTIDCGIDFPATSIDGYVYTLELISRVGSSLITMVLTRNDGLTTSTVISTNIPTGGQSHTMWLTNNATATLLRVHHYGSVYNTLT